MTLEEIIQAASDMKLGETREYTLSRPPGQFELLELVWRIDDNRKDNLTMITAFRSDLTISLICTRRRNTSST